MKRLILIILCSLLLPHITFGQVQETLQLSLDSCRAMALRTNYDVKIAQETIEKANAEKNAIFSMYFPKISGMAGITYVFKDIELLQSIEPLFPSSVDLSSTSIPTELHGPINDAVGSIKDGIVGAWKPIELSLKGVFLAGIMLQQPIYAGGRIVTGNQMAKIGVEMAHENEKLKRSEAILEAEKAYWLFVTVREKVKIAETYMALLNEAEIQVQNAEEAQMVNMNDLMQVRVKQNEVKMQLQMAKSGLELSRMALCHIIGMDYSTPILPIDTVAQVETLLALSADSALDKRSEYKLLQKVVAMKEGEVRLARGNYLPTVGVGASFAYMGNIKIAGQKDAPYNISNVMATVNIPITAWWEGSQKIKSAQRDKRIAELELEKNAQLMELQIRQATFNMNDAYTQVKMAEDALEAAKENLRISNDRYEVQMETMTALLHAQGVWQEAYSKLIDARIDYRIKEVEFLKATGQLN